MSPSRCAAGCADPAGQSDRADGGSAPSGSPIRPPAPADRHRDRQAQSESCTSLGTLFRGRITRRLLLKAVIRQRVNVTSASIPGPEMPLYLAGAGAGGAPVLPLIGNEPLGVGAVVRGNLQHRGCRRPGRVPRFRRLRGGDVRGAARSGVSTDPTSGRSGATTIPLSPTPLVIAEGRGPMTTLRAERVRSGTMMSIRDVRLFVQVVGDGYPLVLMHGGPGADHWTMLPFRQARTGSPWSSTTIAATDARRALPLVHDLGEPDGRRRRAAPAAGVRQGPCSATHSAATWPSSTRCAILTACHISCCSIPAATAVGHGRTR